MLYNVYSQRLQEKYGEKVYKLPVNLPVTCPNRDGSVGEGGCLFCGSSGAGFECLPDALSVKEQLLSNMDYIGKKYKAKKFIAYFQNFSNTYMPVDLFEKAVSDALLPNIVGIDISTRPDCIASPYMEILRSIAKKDIHISIELGLQTVNYHTLQSLNRGHTLAEFIASVNTIKSYGFDICAHMILDLPSDDITDVIEGAKILSALKINSVKLHALYIAKNSSFERLYLNGELTLLSLDDYVNRCVTFLRYLSPEITVQRLIGRAPKKDCVTANFNTSWWKIKDMILDKLQSEGNQQGDLCDDLCGRAVSRFL